MGKLNFTSVFTALLLIGMTNCSKDETIIDPERGDCFSGAILKSVKQQNGTVYYNSNEEKYAVYVTIPGTIDSRDVGFICATSDTLKTDGLSINFDGNYYSYEKGRNSPIGRTEYYYLNITQFKINKE
ncbi:MAG TPA: hypothetical protein VGN64_21190 [Dyadobacter sp.]|jgi:hypothetical protein|nr:hypothetical protein [Dyadobacter sp.]